MSGGLEINSPGAANPPTTNTLRWGKRLGLVAFAFFLLKGLAWLVVPAALALLASR